MKFILMTNPDSDNRVIEELLDSKLRPEMIVTTSPYYTSSHNPLIGFIKRVVVDLRHIGCRSSFRQRYNTYFTAIKYSVPVYPAQRVHSDHLVHLISTKDIDYIFTFSFQLLKEQVFSAPRYGSINFHPSRLPAHRGATPSNWTIAAGDVISGITFHAIDKGMDTGKIIERYDLKLSGYETADVLRRYTLGIGAILLARLVYKLSYGLRLNQIDSVGSEDSYDPPYTMRHVDVTNEMTHEELVSHIRAARGISTRARYVIDNKSYRINNIIPDFPLRDATIAGPYLDEYNNIVHRTSDGRSVLLITESDRLG